jgi:uncharacterized protein with HEPN domain
MIDVGDPACALVGGLSMDELGQDRQRQEALLWSPTILGEALTQVTPSLKSRFPEIPWRQPSRLRNRIVHGYWSIDLSGLHVTTRDQMPDLLVALREVLATVLEETGGADPPGPRGGAEAEVELP